MVKEVIVETVKRVVKPEPTKLDVAKAELGRLKLINQRLVLSNGKRVSEQVSYLEGLIEGLSR